MPDTLDWIVIVGLVVAGVFVSGQWKQYRNQMLMVSAMMDVREWATRV